ncbi:probable membrane-associated kinase regulator 1 [Salvia hispanica]|uniref:probable membrane-associated kinase regulator 1 n=1 Tax=Salvia hispanica TaxID=49212 RepID=UPI00200982F4|nr:probable membrane-associated kinase regulator 1 [Salvia hispanica]
MYNNNNNNEEHNKQAPPRISFSNDLVESSRSHSHYRDAPVSSDFEFSVSSYSMMPADELFFKGRLLPFPLKEENNIKKSSSTSAAVKIKNNESPPKNPTRWRAFLGLTKSKQIP